MEYMPWTEKYRPKTLSQVVGQSKNICVLSKFLQNDAIPHLLLSGPAGTGKTSVAYSLIYTLLEKYGISSFSQSNIIEKNASDENSINDFDEIKTFCSVKPFNTKFPYKFVILDESDNMSNELQSACRRLIETVPPYVKFIFICNYIEKIIDPILSRCAIFRFTPLSAKEVVSRLRYIAENEKINISDEVLTLIHMVTQGDMRSAVQSLQLISKMDILSDKNGEESICHYFGVMLPAKMNAFFLAISNRKFMEARKIMYEIPEINPRNFIRQYKEMIMEKVKDTVVKRKICNYLANADYAITQGCSVNYQIDSIIAYSIVSLEGD